MGSYYDWEKKFKDYKKNTKKKPPSEKGLELSREDFEEYLKKWKEKHLS
ncbi:MAG: hypothetical protein HWN81_17725 [Candidatus Lokiarchaeota archaeon]|nr:hypothetical protein [Candidatus Lokiarchaeota archaeon]